MAHDKIHDLYTSCPNIRFYETKPGGFLGFGRKGYHYCSCTNQKIDDNYLSAVCNRNHWEQTGCSIDQAELFFYGETEYLRTLDLIIDEDELSEEGPPAEESPQNTNTVIEIEELRDYVSNYTGLERGLVERIHPAGAWI